MSEQPSIVQQPIDVSELSVAPIQDKQKCKCQGCPKLPLGHTMLLCHMEGCIKTVHRVCYANMIKKCTTQSVVFDDKVFCTVGHQEKFIKGTVSVSFNWSNDGKNGKDDPLCSENILIDWLSNADNFNKYRSPSDGATKLEIATRIANDINRHGVQVQRSGKSVNDKIQHIQKSMKETCDFINSAIGEGILENEGYASFREKVK